MQNTETNTKFISHIMKGSPDLTLTRGDMVKLLKVVLCEGFNSQNILEVSRDLEDTSLAVISLDPSHGYNFNQVISVEGMESEDLNKEYRVLYTEATKIKVSLGPEALPETVFNFNIKPSGASCKVAPLGFTTEYDDIAATGTACFKNKSLKSPAILKLIDALPPNGYSENWNRYARVVVGQELDPEIPGDFLNNDKVPYTTSAPYAEKVGNGVSGSAGIHGYLKWDYGLNQTTSDSYSEATTTPYGSYPTDWKIIGDGDSFYFFIRAMGRNYSKYTLCTFGLFNSVNPEDTTNILVTGSSRYIASNITSLKSGGAWRSGFTKMHEYTGNFMFKTILGKTQHGIACTFFGLNHDANASYSSWPSKGGINSVNPSTGNILTSSLYIKDSNQDFRGTLRGVQQFYGLDLLAEDMILDEGGAMVLTTRMYNGASSDDSAIPYLFSLRDWEEA